MPKKATSRKTTARAKALARKPAAKKVVAKKTPARKTTAIKDAYTKTEILTHISDQTELTKKQVASVLDEFNFLVERHMKKGGVGYFTWPGMLKCEVKKKPATKARKGINPFTGEETVFQAKPARKVVKVKALKKLKDMVA